MEKFQKTYKKPKLTQEESKNPNRLKPSKEIEQEIWTFPTGRAKAQSISLMSSIKHLKNNEYHTFKYTSKEEEEKEKVGRGGLGLSTSQLIISLIAKSGKYITRNEH